MYNLLSVGKLIEKRYVITLKNDGCEIYYPSKGFIDIINMSRNMMFPLKIENVQSSSMVEVKNSSWYGYLNFGNLKIVQRKRMVIWLP